MLLLFGQLILEIRFTHLNLVPRKLLRFAAAKSGVPMNCNDHKYSEVSKTLKVVTIESHHEVNDIKFVAKILNDQIYVRDIKEIIVDRAGSYDLRSIRPLQDRVPRSDFLKY